ncbi:MAG: galactokinase [Phycisphaeraceae bacterium]
MAAVTIEKPVAADEQLHRLRGVFESRFGRPPAFAAAAPGRVNLIGEHTDYNDGFVLPMAIQRSCLALGAPREDRTARVFSTNMDAGFEIEVTPELAPGEPKWSNYVRGAVAGCLGQGLDPGGFDMAVDSTVPAGGGLSSSAALEVATTTLIEAMTGRRINPVAKALLCQHAEHHFAGMPCGIMDQFISTMGRSGAAMLIDCRSRQVKLVQMSDPSIAVLIVNSNVKHELTSGEYAARRAQCAEACRALGVDSLRDATAELLEEKRGAMEEVIFRRARHVITENQRTRDAAAAITAGDWRDVGELMLASHASLRDDYEVSCRELDLLVELTAPHRAEGNVIGARMTGGGFGGCIVALVKQDAVEEVAGHIAEGYQQQTGIEPALYVTRPAAGARVLEV